MSIIRFDPKGLIRESYRIEGITQSECRSIFLDWAIQIPMDDHPHVHIRACFDFYGQGKDDHPMTRVLGDGLVLPTYGKAKRRGGRQARFRKKSPVKT